MYWTLELASYLEEAPWPASKDELIDFAIRTGAPLEAIENLQELDDDEELYESIEEPIAKCEIITPSEYIGPLMQLSQERR